MRRRVLIVDDHAGFREHARAMLESEGLEVVGEASDGASGLAAAMTTEADVVLLDVQLPDMSGFEVAELLAAHGGGADIILVSTREASDYASSLRTSPVRGFITKLDLSADAIAEMLSGSETGVASK